MRDLLLLANRKRLLDGRTDVAAAFAMVRLNSTYRGPLIRVRRTSDSVEADFGVGQGDVDWSQIASFIGASTGVVPKFYDQSGHGRDAIKTNATTQPQIKQATNGLPGIFGTGNTGINLSTGDYGLTQPWTAMVSFQYTANTGSSDFFDATTKDAAEIWNPGGSQAVQMDSTTGGIASTTGDFPLNQRGTLSAVYNGASSLLAINSAKVASYSGSTGTTAPGGHTLGTESSGNFPLTGDYQLFIAFNTAHTAAQIAADNAAARRLLRF